MKFIVERGKWIRGESPIGEVARLLRPIDGHMCCLGFVCVQSGVDPALIADLGEPWEAPDAAPNLLLTEGDDGSPRRNSSLAATAIEINDDDDIDDDERERHLAALFAEHGHEMEFVP